MRTKRGELSRDRVLRAALALLEREGEGALSMRRLAAELGSAPMSLYRHVANKEDLVDGVIGLALADLTAVGPVGETMQERLVAWLHALRNELNAHPSIVPLMRSNHLLLPAFLGPVEMLMQEFAAAKLPRPLAARACWQLLSFTMNYVISEQLVKGISGPLVDVTFASAADRTDELPLIAAALPELGAVSQDDIFAATAKNLVAGLCAEFEAATA